MNNNDILRSLRYTFDYKDEKMISIFSLANVKVDRAQVCEWLKKHEEDDNEKIITDSFLSAFLNGFIALKRGKKEDQEIINEKRLNNNQILRKLKIALNLKDTDMLEILKLVNFKMSKHELSAFFRKPGQTQFRMCKDQILRKFLYGIQMKYHPQNDD